MVQHRPALGLRHRRPRPGPFLRRPRDRRPDALDLVLRASAAARLLHPVRCRRPRQRGRHHGPVGARGAAVQVRLGHRHQFFAPARRERETVGRRQVLRPDELPQDRRPGGRRHQVRRHHPAGRQDGGGRRRSSGHRGLYRLESEGGAEGRGPRHRVQSGQAAPESRAARLRQLRRLGRRLLQPGQESRAQARDQARPPGRRVGQHGQAGNPAGPAGPPHARLRGVHGRLGQRGLSHGRGPELQQFRAGDRRLPARGRTGPALEPHAPARRQAGQDPAGARPVGQDRLCGLGLRRSGAAVPYHHQRLAHVPGRRRDQGVKPLFRIHVPRRHGLQPGVPEPHAVPRCVGPHRCRVLRTCGAAVDGRARGLGPDGAIPVGRDRRIVVRLPHAGSRLRQPRRAADGVGHRLRFG